MMTDLIDGHGEADVLREIRDLISKVSAKTVTSQEYARLSELIELRSRLMHPPVPPGVDRRRRHFG